jgi:hypothetical protein
MADEGNGRSRGLLATRGRKIAAAVAGAFLVSVGGAVGAWAFQAAKDSTADLLDTSAPISVRVADPGTFTAAWPGGEAWVFPESVGSGPEVLSSEDIAAGGRLAWGWAPSRGGVAGSPQIIRLQVRGRTDEEVSITRIAARIVRTSDPVEGWFLTSVPGCAEGLLWTGELDLDSPPHEAQWTPSLVLEQSGMTIPTVTRADAEEIELVVRTQTAMVEWQAEVFYSSLEGNGSVVVDDDGQPFRVTSESASLAYGVSSDGSYGRAPEYDYKGIQTVC